MVAFLHGVENFRQGEVLFVQAASNFLDAAKMHFFAALARIVFRSFYKKIPKNANYEEFLTKFANRKHHFLNGILILQGAKNHSQNEKKFCSAKKNCRADKKGSDFTPT